MPNIELDHPEWDWRSGYGYKGYGGKPPADAVECGLLGRFTTENLSAVVQGPWPRTTAFTYRKDLIYEEQESFGARHHTRIT